MVLVPIRRKSFAGVLAIIASFLAGVEVWASEKVGELYQTHCLSCHGADMSGEMAPSMLDDEWRYGSDWDTLVSVIEDGRVNDGMPAYGEVLSDEQISSLVIYIRERNARATPPEAPPEIGEDVYESQKETFALEAVADGLEIPWSLTFLSNREGLVSERGGALLRIDLESGETENITGIPEVFANGQGGLLDIAAHPDYEENGWIYLSFSDPSPDGRRAQTKIVRGRINDRNEWVDEEVIFQADDEFYTRRGVHFGCRLVFADGYLFFTIGDRGRQNDAQDLDKPNGKTHRVHEDGRIPSDNPFVDREDAFPTIWTYGNRNAQGLALDPVTGLLWETEHGPRGGDELNLIQKGLNYGWPTVTHGMNYNGTPISGRTTAPGMEDPVTYWTPSLAVCGLDVYRGEAFPGWDGALLSSSLRGKELRLITLNGEAVADQEVLVNHLGRIRDVVVAPDDLVYLVLNRPGRIVRMVPVP